MEFEISLNDLRFYAFHGVFEEENKMGNEFRVDLAVTIPYDDSFEKDQLSEIVSYADLYEIIEKQMKKPSKLLEKVSLSIAKEIKEAFPQILRGKIRIEKVRPPVKGMLGSASVSLKF